MREKLERFLFSLPCEFDASEMYGVQTPVAFSNTANVGFFLDNIIFDP